MKRGNGSKTADTSCQTHNNKDSPTAAYCFMVLPEHKFLHTLLFLTQPPTPTLSLLCICNCFIMSQFSILVLCSPYPTPSKIFPLFTHFSPLVKSICTFCFLLLNSLATLTGSFIWCRVSSFYVKCEVTKNTAPVCLCLLSLLFLSFWKSYGVTALGHKPGFEQVLLYM